MADKEKSYRCESCGASLRAEDKFCSYCGTGNKYYVDPKANTKTADAKTNSSSDNSNSGSNSSSNGGSALGGFLGGMLVGGLVRPRPRPAPRIGRPPRGGGPRGPRR